MLANATESADKIAIMGNSDSPNGVKLQINAIIITNNMLSTTLKVTVSMAPMVLPEKSAFTKLKPGTQRSIIKPAIHLTITKGKLVGDISNIETIDNTHDNITPTYHKNEYPETRCSDSTFFSSDESNLGTVILAILMFQSYLGIYTRRRL
jgi:hypothetical protein